MSARRVILDREGAVEVLFGRDAILDPAFDPDQECPGADVVDRLVAYFGFTEDDYRRLAHLARFRADTTPE